MDSTRDPFHDGERALQARAGMQARMAEIGPRAIRDHMPDQHRDFFARLPFLVVGSVDVDGQPWASVLSGPPGFVQSPDPRTLHVAAQAPAGSPLAAHLRVGAPLGLLGIQPHTRRRNRMNGSVTRASEAGFDVEVEQSFGNCPKYIRTREAFFFGDDEQPAPAQPLAALDDAARALITRADTLFIASAHAAGVDVSHRGGAPGFVSVGPGDVLTLPDYAGNFFFNTLGNLLLEPRAGLLFIDFDSGDLLQVSGRAQIVWEDEALAEALAAHPGAQRLVRIAVSGALRVPGGLPLQWSTTGP
ncbi:pyridoxamine 5'-phosphate oxidase family protein [Methyloversatilis sp.]|uniref:pyridoxamine 5'-phosphate oxidase family protein n=1 Tax=Methyloversatilis sp. TaxID=2569862 RepID=UPI0027347056|nr:pyridoxamine 5'-phosphate oxidase family protein [Methyloversatilis sp.]MDP2868094.1 pyridoxamine 5'-phosphate oxidase family protein [Methyloversatilis sp.]MDP3454920.1 pyridoxamine 5'-phosphate oxidase family protein [Methyloversatilis sp.]MDP3577942.1 pyridoxamine 5'-phosphate oxidase family protein [Methyloversatilis sp.]